VSTASMPESNFRRRVVRSGTWALALQVSSQALSLVRVLVLARILAPEDFGLLGVTLISISVLSKLSETGFQAALVQNKREIHEYLDTGWTVSVLRGLLLCLAIFFGAPHLARFFGDASATNALRLASVSPLISGMNNIGIVSFQRKLTYRRHFLYRVSGLLADTTVSIAAALVLRSGWALILGLVAGSAGRLLASYLLHPFRPRLRIRRAVIEDLSGFGRWIMSSNLLTYFLLEGDDILVGRLLGTSHLGLYRMAYRFSNLPATEIRGILSQVTFSAYARLQDNQASLRRAYLETVKLTTLLSFPAAAGLLVLAAPFTKLFLGEQWTPMVPAMQVLTIFGAARSYGGTVGSLLQGIGKAKLFTRLLLLQLVLLAPIIVPSTVRWGIVGTAVAILIPNIIMQIVASSEVTRLLAVPPTQIIGILAVPLVGSTIMAGVMCAVRALWPTAAAAFWFGIPIGILTYAAAMLTMEALTTYDFTHTILSIVHATVPSTEAPNETET